MGNPFLKGFPRRIIINFLEMKSVERRFNNIARRNPFWSSFISFQEAVKDQNFSRRIIMNYFNKLVEKDDYSKAEKKQIIAYLVICSSTQKKDS